MRQNKPDGAFSNVLLVRTPSSGRTTLATLPAATASDGPICPPPAASQSSTHSKLAEALGQTARPNRAQCWHWQWRYKWPLSQRSGGRNRTASHKAWQSSLVLSQQRSPEQPSAMNFSLVQLAQACVSTTTELSKCPRGPLLGWSGAAALTR